MYIWGYPRSNLAFFISPLRIRNTLTIASTLSDLHEYLEAQKYLMEYLWDTTGITLQDYRPWIRHLWHNSQLVHSFRHSLEEKRHEDKYADEYLEEVRQALGNHVREGHPESESGSVSHRQYATALQSDDQVLSVVFNLSTMIPKNIYHRDVRSLQRWSSSCCRLRIGKWCNKRPNVSSAACRCYSTRRKRVVALLPLYGPLLFRAMINF